MRRLFAALAITAVLILGSFWSFHTVDKTVNEITQNIESGKIDEAYSTWHNAETRFGALLLHEELDKVEHLFSRVLASIASGETQNISAEKAELLTQLKSLPELQKPSLKNLF